MRINTPVQAMTANTGPATAVTMNAKERLHKMSQKTLLIIMDVKSAGTALTLRRIQEIQQADLYDPDDSNADAIVATAMRALAR